MKKLPEGLAQMRVDKRPPIRVNRKTLVPNDKGYAEVVFLGDVHLGHAQCDEERFAAQVSYCAENNINVMLMGDLIENSTRSSIGSGVYEQLEIAQSQHERMVEYLRPLAEKNLIIGSISGNHEKRTFMLSGVDIAKVLCRELRIPYLGDACWTLLRVGKVLYRIYALHGASGSKYAWTKMKAIADISHSFSADCIVMGHVHECADISQVVQEVDTRKGIIVERKKWLIVSGHFVSYDGSYGQTKGYPIPKMGSPKVKFYADRRDMHVSW